MWGKVIWGILIPLLGTCLGASCVFFMKKEMDPKLKKGLTAFAAGIMVSASFFSLIVPAIEESKSLGRFAFVPSVIGFLIGMLFLLGLDIVIPHIHNDNSEEGVPSGLKNTTKMFLAVALHNLPEGMTVGVIFAGWLYGNESISLAGAIVMSVGIALQNFPEGAIVSMPLRAEGMKKEKTFLYGVLSGVVEPIGALLTIFAAKVFLPILPYLLAFAAGAMFYVVVEELIPETAKGEHTNISTVAFAVGFVVMMALDVGLG
ncbi:MAG: ZIP family metal transporter [Clostridia bacterium]|nr:ZIP family metal transporter [Clostridia bacterium]